MLMQKILNCIRSDPYIYHSWTILQLNWRRNRCTHYLATKLSTSYLQNYLVGCCLGCRYKLPFWWRHGRCSIFGAARRWIEQMENDIARHRWCTSGPSHQAGCLQSSVLPRDILCSKNLPTYRVSVCRAKRSLNALKRIKTSLHNTLAWQRLSSLAPLHIHKDMNIGEVVNQFGRANQRQLQLLFD